MRILLADGDDSVRESIEFVFLSADFKVYAVADGDEAVSLGKLYEYDAIVLGDVSDIPTFEVLRRLRVARIKTPIVVVSKVAGPEFVVQALGLGADDYMTKPFVNDELIARIHAVVRRSRGHAQSVINAGPLSLNLDTRTVTVHGAPVHLTNKQFQMVECLMLRKGMTQTKEQILNALYGGRDEPELKIIDVFICKLRKVIAAAGGDPNMIETVWGRGYLIREPGKVDESPGVGAEIRDAWTDGFGRRGGGVNPASLGAKTAEIERSPSIVPDSL